MVLITLTIKTSEPTFETFFLPPLYTRKKLQVRYEKHKKMFSPSAKYATTFSLEHELVTLEETAISVRLEVLSQYDFSTCCGIR